MTQPCGSTLLSQKPGVAHEPSDGRKILRLGLDDRVNVMTRAVDARFLLLMISLRGC